MAVVPDPYKAARATSLAAKANPVPAPTTTTAASTNLTVPKASPVPAPQVTTPTATATKLPIPKTTPIPAPTTPTASTFSTPQYTDWQAKTNEQYANLEKLMQSQFTYDPETDPAYQAQRQLAQLRAGDATKNAMEAANEKGIFGSSVMTSQMGQIQQRAEQEAAAYIPEYRQQAYGQYQDRLANAGTLLSQARSLRGDQFNEAVTEGELTGSYMSPQARTLLNGLFDLKSQAESTGITKEARAALSQQADSIRAQLSGLGVDPSLFGSNVNLNTARGNMAQAGVSTMAKQAQDYAQTADQRDFAEGVRQADRGFNENVRQADRAFEYTAGRDKVQDEQWMKQFDEQVKQNGISNALAWAQNKISQQNANTSAYSATTSRMNANDSRSGQNFNQLMDIWKATGTAPAGIPNVAAGTPYSSGTANKAAGSTTVSAKDSADHMTEARSIISGLSDEEAIAYIQGTKDYYSDADYRSLLNSFLK